MFDKKTESKFNSSIQLKKPEKTHPSQFFLKLDDQIIRLTAFILKL